MNQVEAEPLTFMRKQKVVVWPGYYCNGKEDRMIWGMSALL